MRLSQFIIALLFLVAASISVFSFVFMMYEDDAYAINLSDDETTAKFQDIQDELTEQQSELDSVSQSIFEESPGQPGAEIQQGSLTEGDLIAAAGRAITNVPNYLVSFFSIVFTMSSAVGLGSIPAVWWIVTSFIIIIALLALGIFVKQVL